MEIAQWNESENSLYKYEDEFESADPHKKLDMTVFTRNSAFRERDTQVWHAQAH